MTRPFPSSKTSPPTQGDRRAFCPSLFRIVPARDGGICRVRLSLGRISPAQMRAVAAAAARYGNGVIELTNRANLQIRGVAPDHETALIAAIRDAGLGSSDPARDDVRNVMISPMAGLDPDEVGDPEPLAEPLARTLLDHLMRSTDAPELSPKFSILVDGGGRIGVRDHAHDLWLAAVETLDGHCRLAVGFAGSPDIGAVIGAPMTLIHPDQALPFVARMLDHVIAAQRMAGTVLRMRDILANTPPDVWFGEIARSAGMSVTILAGDRLKPRPIPGFRPLGPHPQRRTDRVAFGAMPFLGRLDPPTLDEIARRITDDTGVTEIRLTPWQGFLVPHCTADMARRLAAGFTALDLVTRSDDPRAALVACAGSPGCAAGFADCKADAARLAAALSLSIPPSAITPSTTSPSTTSPGLDRRVIHLSGCAKGCAHRAMADLTLVAGPDRTYDLYQPGSGGSPFGSLTRTAIPAEYLAETIGRLAADSL